MQNTQKDTPANNYYSKADFWDQRYQAGGYFDWYAEFPQLQYAFQTQYGMSKDDHMLMVGCGNSKVSEQMFQAGYKNIVNIDISPTVIQQMKVLSPGMQWLVMDATQMTFKDRTFDYVIDKGTMDLIAGRDLTPAIKLLKQCMRVTKQQGQLIQITYGSPEGRKKVFQDSLPFSLFDYYFAYVNLNDMSTMINLMRNNLIGQNGQSVQKQMALQKSMKQFMMIKLLRAKRSKQKQFVIWQNYSKSVEPVLTQKVDKRSTCSQKQVISQQKQQQKSQISQSTQQQKMNIIGESKQQVHETVQNDNIKYQSKPQKQSYVYAYSIKRKFGYDYNQQLTNNNKQIIKSFESNDHSYFQIKGQLNINQSILQCNKYCDNKQISYGKINYIQQNQQFSTNNQSIKINLQNGQNITINILTKTNIDLKIYFIDLKDVSQLLHKLSNHLINKMGLSFHPCPKTYSLFTVMKTRMKAKSVNQILNKYWYPTYSFSSIDIQKGQASVIISIPPVLPQLLKQVLQHIQNHFSLSKQIKIAIQASRNGFISFPQLKLLGVLNMVSLSHNSGKSLTVQMTDFWIGNNQKNSSKQESKLFIVENNHLQVPSKLLPLTLLHLMALY